MNGCSCNLVMITDLNNAWLIHKSWSGDTSARLNFFTREHGLIHCHFKGGRLPKKQALLQVFTPLWLSLTQRGDFYYLRQLEPLAASFSLSSQSLFAGLYINELIYYALRSFDAHGDLHDAYVHAVQALGFTQDRSVLEKILRRFELVLLATCGYQLLFNEEAHSGKAIMPTSYYRLLPGQGFVPAKEGVAGEYLLAMAKDEWDDPNVLLAAKGILRQAIAHALEGKTIQTRALYRLSLDKIKKVDFKQ
jgi:DNA repair protein RecO (recombination protein O)